MDSLTAKMPSHADAYGESSVEELILKWLAIICEGLSNLHQVGYAHCDVSPKNLIVSGPDIFLPITT